MRILTRSFASLLAAFAVASTAAIAHPPSAQAIEPAYQVRGWDMENEVHLWQKFEGGDGTAGYDINRGVAHRGENNGWLHVGNGWAAWRTFMSAGPLGPPQHRRYCYASAAIQVVGDGAQVGLEVWGVNHDYSWTRVRETYPWVAGGGYRPIQILWIDDLSMYREVWVQVIYGSSGGPKKYVRFDEVTLSCNYFQ